MDDRLGCGLKIVGFGNQVNWNERKLNIRDRNVFCRHVRSLSEQIESEVLNRNKG